MARHGRHENNAPPRQEGRTKGHIDVMDDLPSPTGGKVIPSKTEHGHDENIAPPRQEGRTNGHMDAWVTSPLRQEAR